MTETRAVFSSRRGALLALAIASVAFLSRADVALARTIALRAGPGASAGPTLRTSISDARVSTYSGGALFLETAFPLHAGVRLGVRSGLQRVKTKGVGKGMAALWVGPSLEGSVDLLGGRWHAGVVAAYQLLEDDGFLPVGFLFSQSRAGVAVAANMGATYALSKRVGLRSEIGARGQVYGRYRGNSLTYGLTPYGAAMVEVLVGNLP